MSAPFIFYQVFIFHTFNKYQPHITSQLGFRGYHNYEVSFLGLGGVELTTGTTFNFSF